ncbi:hypothetical protein DPMN_113932 [Dreissena polymorpha]|uniref:Uncharacterized protein n=1 Tax=Dreissena polymorpha TaxID=45954 RepID=A0A9D4KJ38_DREPO|nr:hypothetical protein DPMN_113932 [Dreissena polymorpha]
MRVIKYRGFFVCFTAQSNPLKKDPNGTTTLLIVDTSGKMAGDAMIQTEQFLDTFMAGKIIGKEMKACTGSMTTRKC